MKRLDDTPVAQPVLPDIVDEKRILQEIPISRRHLKNLRDEGKIPYFALGRRVLYSLSAVHAALLRMQKGGSQ